MFRIMKTTLCSFVFLCELLSCSHAADNQWYFAKYGPENCVPISKAFTTYGRLGTLFDVEMLYRHLGYVVSEEKHTMGNNDAYDMFSFRASFRVKPGKDDFYVVLFNDQGMCHEVIGEALKETKQ